MILGTYTFAFQLGMYLEVGLLGHRVHACFLKRFCQHTTSLAVYERSNYSISLPALSLGYYLATLTGMEWYLILGLICFCLMTKEFENPMAMPP